MEEEIKTTKRKTADSASHWQILSHDGVISTVHLVVGEIQTHKW